MRTLERGPRRESLDAVVMSVAQTYGFTTSPVSITRNDLGDVPDNVDRDTALVATITRKMGHVTQTVQAWGTAKKGGGTNIVFAAASPKLSIAQAFVVKAALATVEAAGFEHPLVLISSVGDAESRRRYVRELGNFFKKHGKDLPEEVADTAHKSPDDAVRILIESEHPLGESLPRTIDYLSESSRKIMLETITLFEALEIRYELDSRLPYAPDFERELIFAVVAEDRKGNMVRIASGGRFQEEVRGKKKEKTELVGMSVTLDESLDIRGAGAAPAPACFVLHIGEAAKMRAFTLLDSLWRAQVALDQALLSNTIAEQTEKAKGSGAKYYAIIGQREALDDTIIIKNAATQLQETISIDKFISRMSRVQT